MSEARVDDPRIVLRRHGLAPKKSWGQNFLVDPRVHDRIVKEAVGAPGCPVIEIGAGAGTMTARLLEAGARVVAIERDRDLAAVLRAELGDRPALRIEEANALTFDYARAFTVPAVAVGNLPYQIASQILFRLLEAGPAIRKIVVMVQREVADRLVAGPGTPSYGALSVGVQLYAAPRIVTTVRPGSFFPPPRVVSAVVAMEPGPALRAGVKDVARFRAVVQAAFGHRRKTLWNALRGDPRLAASDEEIGEALARADVDPGRRGETLSLHELARLANELVRATPGKDLHA